MAHTNRECDRLPDGRMQTRKDCSFEPLLESYFLAIQFDFLCRFRGYFQPIAIDLQFTQFHFSIHHLESFPLDGWHRKTETVRTIGKENIFHADPVELKQTQPSPRR